MKKTLFALLLVVALVVAVSAVAVSAAEVTQPVAPAQLWSNLTVAADGATATGYCPHCCETTSDTITWTKLPKNSSHVKIESSGHYFVPEGGQSGNGALELYCENGYFVLHLNGQTHKRNSSGGNNTGAIRFRKTGINCYILDNETGNGKLDGDAGWAITNYGWRANVTQYSGTITTNRTAAVSGSTSTSANDNGGTIRMSSGSYTMFGGILNGTKADRGGAIYATGITMHIVGGTINGGNVTNYGGALQVEDATCYVWGGTINGGTAGNHGGAICVHGSTGKLYIKGGTIQGGTATKNYGGSVATMKAGTLVEMTGGTIDATNSSSSSGRAIGINPGTVKLLGGTIKGAGANTIYMANNASSQLTIDGLTAMGKGDGFEKDVADRFRIGHGGLPSASSTQITLGEYTGYINIDPYISNDVAANYPVGMVIENVTLASNFDTEKEIYLYDGSSSRRPLAINAENKLQIAGLMGIKADGTGKAVAEIDNTDGTYAYYEVFSNGNYELKSDAIVDLNNRTCAFDNTNYKLSLVDYRTDAYEVNLDDNGELRSICTVTSTENLAPLTIQPRNGHRYLVVKTDKVDVDGNPYYSANRISVALDTVSLKTSSASLYYTTSVKSNYLGAKAVEEYGVAFSLSAPIGDDFYKEEVYNANGILYTVNEYTPVAETALNETAVSALVEDVLVDGAEDNAARAELPIYANAYVKVKDFNGNELYLMADQGRQLTYKEIIEKLDAQLGADAAKFEGKETIIANFYNAWLDPMAAWELPNIKALTAA